MLESGMRMTRGKLCVSAVRKSGKKAYNLQYRRKTKQFVKSIPTDQVEMFRESTENCRAFLDLVQRHVDARARVSSATPGGCALSGWPVEGASAGG